MKLEIENLKVSYDADVVLSHLSLTVQEGEFLALLGPSGCGKSTLLKAIAGILPPSGGCIRLGSVDITRQSVHKRGTVVVFQDVRLFPHMTVLDNVAFPLKMQGVDKKSRRLAAAEYLDRVQMGGFSHRLPGELSGGQQQRVALARALAAKPRLLLLDEPFSALDENLREDMRTLVTQLHREYAMTTILVTHDREEALSMSGRVAMMFGGRIHQVDTPQKVYHQPATRQTADYFGDCIYLPGRVEAGVFCSGSLALEVPVPDGDFDLLLRPDQLEIGTGPCSFRVEGCSFRGRDTLVTFRDEQGNLWKKPFPGTPAWVPGQTLPGSIHVSCPVLFPRLSQEKD